MRILDNGIYRDATKEEVDAMSSVKIEETERPITTDDRIEALEAALMELAEVVLNG